VAMVGEDILARKRMRCLGFSAAEDAGPGGGGDGGDGGKGGVGTVAGYSSLAGLALGGRRRKTAWKTGGVVKRWAITEQQLPLSPPQAGRERTIPRAKSSSRS